MNYFELHIGDLTEATAHLSMLEDGAYGRLLRKYYATEKPLPADVKQVQRLVGARTKEEREAVETVLAEFFDLQDDGWHQSRCDAEIAVYRDKMSAREAAREGEKERQRKARERRKQAFATLREHGVVPKWDTTGDELERMLSRVTGLNPSAPVTAPVTRDNTASQTPITSPQTPVPREEKGDAAAQHPDPTPRPTKPKKAKAKAVEVTLAEWLAAEVEAKRPAIPSDDPIFTWMATVSLPREFLQLAWTEFKTRYTAPPMNGKQKTYVDWRAVFRKAVRENWLRLWMLEGQQFLLTTAGQQAQREHQQQGGRA